jgi:transposase
VPSGVKLMPHRHPEDRVYTVMSGVFYIGLGDQFDGDKVVGVSPGATLSSSRYAHRHSDEIGRIEQRGQVGVRLANMPPCLVGMEACVGAHHLSRHLLAFGHDVKLVPGQFVKPFLKGQKRLPRR